MRKNVKHFVLTILQFYYFFKFKIAYSYQCNSKIPPQKVSLVFKGVTWLGKLHFNL